VFSLLNAKLIRQIPGKIGREDDPAIAALFFVSSNNEEVPKMLGPVFPLGVRV